MKPKIDIIVDLQFGSTGKGALAGYLSEKKGYSAIIAVNMPNAGHTAYDPISGEKYVHKVLPSGIFSNNLRVIGIGPGSIFDVDRLAQEIQFLVDNNKAPDRLVIHEAAGILQPHHAEIERNRLNSISSTMQGSGAALSSKIFRERTAIAKSHVGEVISKISPILGGKGITMVNQAYWLSAMEQHDKILLEGSQGYSLGISAGFYPYCTSRDCTPARVLSDASLPMSWKGEVYGSCRTFPIRVGNTEGGFSGHWYPDQDEVTFESIGVEPELTTVTGRVRRIASFSSLQIREAMQMAHPDHVFLNFCNYLPTDDQVIDIMKTISHHAEQLGCGEVSFTGWGPKPSDICYLYEN
jgi:adenylosuccinate synthase